MRAGALCGIEAARGPTSLAAVLVCTILTCVQGDIPDVRDGLTRKERVVLWVLSTTQAERGDRNVPLPLLYGRVLEYADMSIAELQEIVARLGARRPESDHAAANASSRAASRR